MMFSNSQRAIDAKDASWTFETAVVALRGLAALDISEREEQDDDTQFHVLDRMGYEIGLITMGHIREAKSALKQLGIADPEKGNHDQRS
jgi:hypothetical protein